MKKIAIFISLLLVISLSACEPAPAVKVQRATPVVSPSAQTPEPSFVSSTPVVTNTPEPSPDGARIDPTDKQKDEISALLDGELNMTDDGTPVFFQDAGSLTTSELLGFVYTVLNDMPDSAGVSISYDEDLDKASINGDTVKKIIRSAFGVDYKPKKGDYSEEGLTYNGSCFIFQGSDGAGNASYAYSYSRQSSGSILVKFDIIQEADIDRQYLGMGEAVLQEDADSLFGYRLISLTEADDMCDSFTKAEASSCLPADGSKTYVAANAIDGYDSTAWATRNKKGEWIKLSFDKPEDLTGLILDFGDWSSDDAFEQHALPSSCVIEFSDGTSLTDNNCEPEGIEGYARFTFDKVIRTSYVKITITDIDEGDDGANGGVYVSEIEPF